MPAYGAPAPGGFTPAAPYGNPPSSGSNGMAIAALVLGLISLAGTLFCGAGVLFGAIAIVLGVLGVRKANELVGQPQRGVAIAGIVTGALGVLASLAFILVVFVFGSSVESDFEGINTDPSDGVCDQSRFLQDPDC